MGQFRWRVIPARNASRYGQLLNFGGRSFQSLAFVEKKDDLLALIIENGIENQCLSDGLM